MLDVHPILIRTHEVEILLHILRQELKHQSRLGPRFLYLVRFPSDYVPEGVISIGSLVAEDCGKSGGEVCDDFLEEFADGEGAFFVVDCVAFLGVEREVTFSICDAGGVDVVYLDPVFFGDFLETW